MTGFEFIFQEWALRYVKRVNNLGKNNYGTVLAWYDQYDRCWPCDRGTRNLVCYLRFPISRCARRWAKTTHKIMSQTEGSVMLLSVFGVQCDVLLHFRRGGCLKTFSPQRARICNLFCMGCCAPSHMTGRGADSSPRKLKSHRAHFCCSWLVERVVPIKFTSNPRGDPARCNQRSASNPVLFRSHKQHLNENIHGHLQRGESDEGVPTSTLHCFQFARQCRANCRRHCRDKEPESATGVYFILSSLW